MAAEVAAGGPVELLALEGRRALLGREAEQARQAPAERAAQPVVVALLALPQAVLGASTQATVAPAECRTPR